MKILNVDLPLRIHPNAAKDTVKALEEVGIKSQVFVHNKIQLKLEVRVPSAAYDPESMLSLGVLIGRSIYSK